MSEGGSAKRRARAVIDVLGYGLGLLLFFNFAGNAWFSDIPMIRLVCAVLAVVVAASLTTVAVRQFRR